MAWVRIYLHWRPPVTPFRSPRLGPRYGAATIRLTVPLVTFAR